MMAKRSARLAGLTMLVFIAVIAMRDTVVLAQTQQQPAAAPPTPAPGDTWTIRYSNGIRGTRKFLREESGILIFEVTQSWKDGSVSHGLLHLTRDLSIVRMLGADGTEHRRFDPHSLGLQFPLEVGKEWEERCQRFDGGKLAGTFVGTYKVVGVEEIVAPAGRFQAFRVEGETYEPQAPARRWRFTHWYAADVRTEVKFQATEPDGSAVQYELVEFRPADSIRTPVPWRGLETFVGVWEGHWKETILAIRLTVERVDGDAASVIYWRGASRYPAFQPPSEQRIEGRFLDEKTLRLEVWDEARERWAEATFTLNRDGTLTGKWSGGEAVLTATLKREP